MLTEEKLRQVRDYLEKYPDLKKLIEGDKMPGIKVIKKTVALTVEVNGQGFMGALHDIINYGLNNMPPAELPAGEDLDEIKSFLLSLAEFYD